MCKPAHLFLCVLVTCLSARAAEPFILHARSRVQAPGGQNDWVHVENTLQWNPARTAVIVCDMWDRHWCRGATERVAELGPRINEVLRAARARGALIVHAPSDTMDAYEHFPQRQRARSAQGTAPPASINEWKPLSRDREGPLPVDDADGGCDDDPPCPQGKAWSRQIGTIEIAPPDVISDQGAEIQAVLDQARVENVVILGVHANMCVLGRPFAIRAQIGLGRQVVLVRDLTDTMYNSRARPFVSHHVGTDLVVEHIEKYWCPTISSADFTGTTPLRFKTDRRPQVLFLIGEDEYQTAVTLPRFADQELTPRAIRSVVVAEQPSQPGHFPRLREELAASDLLVVSTRRRALQPDDLASLRAHLAAGRPLVGLRTASHAFSLREPDKARMAQRGLREWPEFDAEVLGGNYSGHHGAGPRTTLEAAPGMADHVLLRGVEPGSFSGHGSLYRSGPLGADSQALILGTVPGQPGEPVAWTRRFGSSQARVFYTSLGHPGDFEEPGFRRLLLNGILWALDMPLPTSP